MNELLSLAEIHARYPSEWVLLVDPQYDEREEIVGGRVLWHSKDRDEVYRKDLELQPQSAAYHYTGELPDNSVVVL
ncbi:MAG TPA: hypothetical protein VGM03_04610 [Phycisphaerae bacterium]|jgi:hypothetical protein